MGSSGYIEERHGIAPQNIGQGFRCQGVFHELFQLPVPGIGDIGKIRTIHDPIRAQVSQPYILIRGEKIGNRHGRVKPEGVNRFYQPAVGGIFPHTEVRYANLQTRISLQQALCFVGTAQQIG